MRSRRWKFAASLGLLLCLSASIAVGGFAADASVAEQKGYPGGGDWDGPPYSYAPQGSKKASDGHYYYPNSWTTVSEATCINKERQVRYCVWQEWDWRSRQHVQCNYADYEEVGEVNPNNHVNTTTINKKEATCTEEGYTGDLYCKDCNKRLQKGEAIPKTAHKWDNGKVTTKPTCTDAGVKTYTCTRCKTTRTETIKATGHQWKKGETVAPTCTDQGYTLYVCQNDGSHTDKRDYKKALGHDWDNGKVTTPATCTEDGVKTYTCKRCKTTRTEPIAKTGHTPVSVPAKAATCTETGLTEGKECEVCHATLVKQEVTPALGHDWDDWKVTKEATCTETGVKTRTCKRDASHTETEAIAATGHVYTEKVVSPTCESDGYTIFTCNNCGDIYTGNVTAKLGHDYQLKDHKDATCTEAGYDYYECSRDALHNYTEAIPALGHDWNTTSTGVDNCVNVSFRHENETITLCPICGVQNGTQRLNKVTLYTAHAKLVVLRGVLENGMEAMTVAFYEPGISSVTACQRCGAVRDSFSSGASLPQAAENAHFTVDASLVDGYTVMLVQADGTETVLTPGISNGKAIFDVDMKGQGARLLHLVPTTAA